ncbi:class I SAM-dependent methyltransferase [Cellulosilyticum ruminicola]|uniref:class I SAM-dependent methyltransferase n=1 Tax=Cellulosilyticum ruminicola TaxID=425254 RepID=UPI0009FAC409|nr:class I SAM-dependent methyltransferase [Cellulosilyticum ruminicola]
MIRRQEAAIQKGLKNISFVTYDGIHFPFEEGSFNYVVTRYALHHFPKIEETFKEIGRILKPKGQLFIADPTPCKEDNERFVDQYMQMKKDGHIKYYTKGEFIELAAQVNMELKAAFETPICFPRINESGYKELIKRHSKEIIEKYKVYVTEDNQYIYITQNVLNLTFEKR